MPCSYVEIPVVDGEKCVHAHVYMLIVFSKEPGTGKYRATRILQIIPFNLIKINNFAK